MGKKGVRGRESARRPDDIELSNVAPLFAPFCHFDVTSWYKPTRPLPNYSISDRLLAYFDLLLLRIKRVKALMLTENSNL